MIANHRLGSKLVSIVCLTLSLCLFAAVAATPANAGVAPGPDVVLVFDTEFLSLNLTGGPVAMPLASDPGNALGDSIEGFGFVNSAVNVTLSSQRLVNPGPDSLGMAHAFSASIAALGAGAGGGEGAQEPTPLTPGLIDELDGQSFFVDSFFDVFFDITVTDVDARAGRNFAGMPDGASIMLPDIGPADMQSNHQAIFDKDAPNFGLIPPPQSSPYIGHFLLEIPLGGDINGNGINDKLKFTLATHAVGDENRTFIILPDGTVIDNFDSTASLEGAVVDVTSDPPFGPFALSGPTSASSNLLNPIVPEPSSVILLAAGGLLAAACRLGRRN